MSYRYNTVSENMKYINSAVNKLFAKITALSGIGRNGLQKYSANAFWFLTEYVFSLLAGFFIGISAARFLGPSSYGVITFSLTVYAVALGFGSLGINDLIIRDGLRNENECGKIYGTAFVCRTAALYFSMAVSCLYAYLVYDYKSFKIVFLILAQLIFQPLNILSLFFQMKVAYRFAAIAKIFGYGISSALKVIFIITDAPVICFAFSILIDSILNMAALLFLYKKSGYSFKDWKFDKYYLKYFTNTGAPLFLIYILHTLYLKINVIMIQRFMTENAVGIYGAAQRLSEVSYIVPHIITASLFPAIIKSAMSGEDYNLIKNRIKLLLNGATGVFIICALMISTASDSIVIMLYGKEYYEAGAVLAILIWTLPFYFFDAVTMKYLLSVNNIMISLFRPATALVSLICLAYPLNYYLGIRGFALSMLFSFIIAYFIMDLFFKDTRSLFFMKLQSVFFPITALLKRGKL